MEEKLEATTIQHRGGYVGVVKCWYGETLLWDEQVDVVRNTIEEAMRDAVLYKGDCVRFCVNSR